MKSISKVPNKVSEGGSKHKKHETEVVDDTKDLKDVVEKKKIKKMTKLKSVKKIKSIMDIDDDLALKMKKEVEEGKEAVEAEEADDEEEWVEDESSLEDELAIGQAGKGEVGRPADPPTAQASTTHPPRGSPWCPGQREREETSSVSAARPSSSLSVTKPQSPRDSSCGETELVLWVVGR